MSQNHRTRNKILNLSVQNDRLVFMGRPKGFKREEVLAKTISLFWKKGFADTSLQDLEKATGVNKSGLYSEFKDKEDLYLATLKQYIATNGVFDLLEREPLGWKNLEDLLAKSSSCTGPRGCFVANSVRESSVIPSQAKALISTHIDRVHAAVRKNLVAAGVKKSADLVTELILTFNAGLCLEANMSPIGENKSKKTDAFLFSLKESFGNKHSK